MYQIDIPVFPIVKETNKVYIIFNRITNYCARYDNYTNFIEALNEENCL